MPCNCPTPHSTAEFEGGRVKISDYYNEVQPTWCGGCGDHAIMAALKRTLVDLDIAPDEVLLCFDVGCNSNMSDKLRGYRVHALHGRVLPFATAAKIAHPKMKVIAFAGDGATYSEGVGHFVNSIRGNYPITFFVHDNGTYGLTTGQASATTPQGALRTSNPDGPTSSTLNPLELALSLEPAFVARSSSADISSLVEVMKEAILFQEYGFAYVDILQACPTYNKDLTHEMMLKRLKDIKDWPDYDPSNLANAQKIARDLEHDIPNGILYMNKSMPNYLSRLKYRTGETTVREEVQKYDISSYLEEYK